MPRVPSKSKCAHARWRKVAIGIAIVWAYGSSLLGGCASSSDRRAAPPHEDLQPSEAAQSQAAATDGAKTLAPWRASTGPTTTVVLRGSTASYQAFVNAASNGAEGEMVQQDLRPQEWAQAGAPPLSTLVHTTSALAGGLPGETPAFVVRNRIASVLLPSGRQFLSLSIAVEGTPTSTAGAQTTERVLASTPAAAAEVGGAVDVLSREEVLRPGAQKILLVATSAPAYSVREWTTWAKIAAARGTEVSLWLRTSSALADLDALRSLVVAGGGHLWIGGTVEGVVPAWREMPLATLGHATVHLKFDPHLIRRHRVIGSAVSRARNNHSATWRPLTVYSMLVELGVEADAPADVDIGRATVFFEGPHSQPHRAEILLPSLTAAMSAPDPAALRQVSLGLAAECLRGKTLSSDDREHLARIELDANPRVQQRLLRAMTTSPQSDGAAQ